MSKFTILMSAAALSVGGGYVALPAPAAAQAQPNIAEIIVYGNDPCPRSTDDQVVVCARRPENERYRIPQNMRQSGTPQQMQSWAVRSKSLETAGATGINSCSPVGPGRLYRLPVEGDQGSARRAQAAGGRRKSAAALIVQIAVFASPACSEWIVRTAATRANRRVRKVHS